MTSLPQQRSEKRLGLVIDLDTCVGCHACVVNCKEWNTSGHPAPLSDQNAKRRLLYAQGRNRKTGAQQYALHHGACFAATRWTNLYDLGNLLSTGDPISGSMAENFGAGVEKSLDDVEAAVVCCS